METNKQWLINEIEIMGSEESGNYPHNQVVDRELVIKLVEGLDEPRKVIIPQFVADCIRFSKEGEDSPRVSMGEAYISKELNDWLAKTEDYMTYPNQEKFMRAWLDGYEVEKEKLYYVIIPTKDPSGEYYYLDGFGGIDSAYDLKEVEHHTESFIRLISENLWQFAKEVTE